MCPQKYEVFKERRRRCVTSRSSRDTSGETSGEVPPKKRWIPDPTASPFSVPFPKEKARFISLEWRAAGSYFERIRSFGGIHLCDWLETSSKISLLLKTSLTSSCLRGGASSSYASRGRETVSHFFTFVECVCCRC